MAKESLRGWSLSRTVLLGATALALGAAPAMARVGVTSATDGDPLGKPPMENERVLRIGIDVQANEAVRTGATDRAHLVFLDGTSVTVGPNARLTIDRFVYDPDAKKGDLAITATQGVFRLVGGKISKSNAITVTTPSSTIGIRGGITIFRVTANDTLAAFVFGTSLTATAAGQTQTVTRPGFQIQTNAGSPPGAPTAIPKGSLGPEIAALEGGSSQGGTANADQRAQSSGFSARNSGQPPSYPPISSRPLNNATSNVTTNAVSAANTQVQVDTASPPPPTPSDSQTTFSASGFASGLVGTSSGETSSMSTPVLGTSPNIVISNKGSAAGQVTGQIVLRQADTSVTTLELGGTAGTSVFIDGKKYVMVTTDDPARPSTVRVNNHTYTVANSSYVVSSGLLEQPGAFGSCTCEYLTWGQWGTVIAYPSGYRHGQTDFVSLGTYVGGTMTPQVQMPQTGSATYTGSMMGNVWNHGSTYNATGSYSSTWGFASRAGSFSASFDGASYSGSAAATAGSGGTAFTGTFSGGNGTGNLSGAFFGSPSDAAKYQAGAFTINGTSYKAAGAFAGQR